MPYYPPAAAADSDATLTFTDITTNNSSTSKHGFLKKLDNTATNFMNGAGNWAAPGISAAGLNAGTSFPGSPATSDLYNRTDIMGGTIFFYDGTRWRTVQTFTGDPSNQAFIPMSADGNVWGTGLWQPTYSVYLLDFRGTTYVATTNDGTKYWTVALTNYLTGATISSFTTAADTVATATNHVVAVNAVSTAQTIGLNVGKTSTPGVIYPMVNFTYQVIAT